ncbi:FAD synthase [Candidatus Curtissbacteria bacterium]|nr:FAD synthase [Candidatus Curtissbacteria bacterium]
MKKVLVFGAFDGLHPGHLDFFRQAKKFGDFLIVSVGTDKNVERIKGRKPLFSQKERLNLVASCRMVDKAVLGAEEDFYLHIKQIAPDVIGLGYDQWAGEDEVKKELESIGLSKTKVVRLKPYKNKRAKSTMVKRESVDY